MYADSSALVKLIVEEPESLALERHLKGKPLLATSRIAVVEVLRATGLANPAPDVQDEAERLLSSCMLVDVTDALVNRAATLASATIRTLDAVHLASALKVAPDELIAYDRRLLAAAARHGLVISSPGVRLSLN